jgi:hypothetical protein
VDHSLDPQRFFAGGISVYELDEETRSGSGSLIECLVELNLIPLKWLDLHPHSRWIKDHAEVFEETMPPKQRRNTKFIAKSRHDSDIAAGKLHIYLVKVS